MKRVLPSVLLVLALAPGASAAPTFGATEDSTKFADDGGALLYDAMATLGMTENRVAVFWDPDEPDVIQDQAFLDRSLPLAERAGIETTFSVYASRSLAFASDTEARIALFAAYLKKLARTYPQVKKFVVGNEPNQPRFWRPQFAADGAQASAAAYERLLAAGYDALKDVNPAIDVVGVGLSPRGNDNPNAKDNRSTSPVRFLQALGRAYRASGRTAPLMDQLAFHPYPNVNTDPPGKGYGWPNAGVPNLDRIKQAVWDAFNGTGQPTFPETERRASVVETPGSDALTFTLDEVGWQVTIPPLLRQRYSGRENVPTITERQQAHYYTDAVRLLACDPTVATILFFHLVDEPDLDRFQSGLLRVDGSRRPSFAAVRRAIAAADACATAHLWRHTTRVVGARARFRVLRAGVRAVVSVHEAGRVRAAIVAADEGGAVAALARAKAVPIHAYRRLVLRPWGRLAPGAYVVAVRFSAEANPARRTTVVSRVLRVRG